jgi:hypothetical protein
MGLIGFIIGVSCIGILVGACLMPGNSTRTIGVIILPISILVFISGIIIIIRKGQETQKREAREKQEALERETRKQQEAKEKAEQEAKLLQNKKYYEQMSKLCESSISIFESMPKYLVNAEKYLDQAQYNFKYNAFAPFWDSIENATQNLAQYYRCIKDINNDLSKYKVLVKENNGKPLPYPLSIQSITSLPVGKITSERMNNIIWEAQRNFQFAMIYEQRKTNQILVAGFTNLANALSQMTYTITNAISELSESVNTMSTEVNSSISNFDLKMGNIINGTDRYREDQAIREKKTIELLDNIRRGER